MLYSYNNTQVTSKFSYDNNVFLLQLSLSKITLFYFRKEILIRKILSWSQLGGRSISVINAISITNIKFCWNNNYVVLVNWSKLVFWLMLAWIIYNQRLFIQLIVSIIRPSLRSWSRCQYCLCLAFSCSVKFVGRMNESTYIKL